MAMHKKNIGFISSSMLRYGCSWKYSMLLLAMLASCSPSSRNTEPATGAFFDLKQYFQEEVERLENAQLRAVKVVKLDGREERQEIQQLNYEDELAPFASSDINKPSWKDKYKVDSLFQDSRLAEVAYVARDSSLKTRALHVRFEGGAVSEIWIKNSIQSIISQSKQDLRYAPGKGYSIEGKQGGRFSGRKYFSVFVEFDLPEK